MEIGPGLLGREDGTANHHHIVDPGLHQCGGDTGCHLGGDTRPRREFIARQTQAHDGRGGSSAHRTDDGACERESVGAPLVATMVGEPRQELAHQAVLAGVHLHPVAPGPHRQGSGRTETGHHRSDVVGFHPLRNLAAVHLGYPRRGPQWILAVGARALPAGVVERGDHERAVDVACRGDGLPPGGAALGQRGPFVRPIAAVHTGTFSDHDARTTAGTAGVVGDVPLGEAPFIVAEVGDVRPEHHPVGCGGMRQTERFEQVHDG